ncbi:PIN domain-like protein [Sparassis latifolia]
MLRPEKIPSSGSYFFTSHISCVHVVPIFIFDDPGRPTTKRGTHVVTEEHWLSAPTHRLISTFGFVCHTAPAEAEAELAQMNVIGYIDAILTDDSDAFVFEAKTVMRNPNVKVDKDRMTVYTTNDIRDKIDDALTLGGLHALTLGGQRADVRGTAPHHNP